MFKSLFGGGKKKAAHADVGGNKELLTLTMPLDVEPEAAFTAFIDDLGAWWPKSYTFSGDALQKIGIEARYKGVCFEETTGGERIVWGTVLAFDRPNHIVIAWQISPDRQVVDNEAVASRLDVRFTPRDGGSNLLIVHRDFPRHGDGWEAYKEQMAGAKGWPLLADAFRQHLSQG